MNDEEWRTIPGFPNYSVSSCGQIRRDSDGRGTYAGRLLSLSRTKRNYLITGLCREGKIHCRNVHRIVAEVFVPGRTEARDQVNHIDGNKQNNHSSNLEWCTSAENVRHSVETGLISSRLSRDQVLEIRERCAAGESPRLIAADYGIGPKYVSKIKLRRNWVHV